MNIKHLSVILLILVSALVAHQLEISTRSFDAEQLKNQIKTVERSDSTGLASHIRLNTPLKHNGDIDSHAERFFSEYPLFGVSDYRNELKFAGKQRDLHFPQRYTAFLEQHHQGMKVFGSGIRLHFNEENHIESADGIFVPDLENVDTNYVIERGQAGEIALNHFGKSNAVIEEIQPMIYRHGLFSNRKGDSYATWCCTVTDHHMNRDRIFVHAQTGEILATISLINSIDRVAWKGKYLVGEPFWEEGESFPTNSTDANVNLNASLAIYTAFQNAFNITSYDNLDSPMITVFDLVDDPQNPRCPDAFWNGTVYASCPGVVAFDIAAHEWGHAYIENSADLTNLGQSGAINEGFADIIGESIQLLFATNYPVRTNFSCNSGERWIIGEDIQGLGFTNGFRDMYNPNCFFDPRSVNDIQYIECNDVDEEAAHTNAGIVNQLYSLSVDGGELNGVTVTGVGLLKGFHIFMRTLLLKLTPSSNFNDLAVSLQDSCNELIGLNLTDPTTGNTTTESISATDCTSIDDAIAATELTSPFCAEGNTTTPEEPQVFVAFPPVGEVGNISTTVYFLASPGFSQSAVSNATCLIIDGNFTELIVPARVIDLENFAIFSCDVPTNYTVGDELFITVSGDGENYSTTGLNFTYTSRIFVTSVEPDTGFVGGGTIVTVTGSNFENFTGCQPFVVRDINGDIYDCLTCIFGNVTEEHLVAGHLINSTTMTCRAPSYYSLLYPSETVRVWVSKNAQIFTSNANATFTYLLAQTTATATRTRVPTASSIPASHSHTPSRSPHHPNPSRTSSPRPHSASRTPTSRPDEETSSSSMTSPFFAMVFASFVVLMTVFLF